MRVQIPHANGQLWGGNVIFTANGCLKEQDQQFFYNRIRASEKRWTKCIAFQLQETMLKSDKILEAKDVLPNINHRQAAKRALTFDLWPWPSNSPERATKRVFPVNLAQIRPAVPEVFHTQTKKSQTAPKTEPSAVHRAVTMYISCDCRCQSTNFLNAPRILLLLY